MSKERTSVSASVPTGIVKKLQQEKDGINPIIDDLRKNHMLEVSFDGHSLTLMGWHEDILDMATELLVTRSGMKQPQGRMSLGGGGTVVWTFEWPISLKLKLLFDSELQEILKSNSAKQLPDSDEKILKISCEYSVYKTMKQAINDLENKFEQCSLQEKSIDTAEFQKAKKFAENKNNCCQLVHNKIYKKKYELHFCGKDKKSCKNAIAAWESYKKQIASGDKGREQQQNSKTTSVMSTPASQTHTSALMESDWEDRTPSFDVSKKGGQDLSKPQMETSTMTNVKSSRLTQNKENNTIKSSTSSTVAIVQTAGVSSTKLKREVGKISGSGEKVKYSCSIGDMNVHVYKESIIDIKGMDAITNAANEKLMHGGGVAFHISKAAGRKMDQDCKTFIEKNGKIPVTQNYVSIPGEMKCKGIIHAVGPTWWDYTDRQDECAKDLYETIKNVFKEIRSRGWGKVALSAISSGLFGVPKKLCAEMYVKAFADFANEGPGTLKDVHFIDINRDILELVIDAHKNWVKVPESLSFKNAFKYLSTTTGSEQKNDRKDRHSNVAAKTSYDVMIKYEGEGTTSYGQRMYKYRVGDKMKLFVYNGSLARLEIEAICFPIGTTGSQLIGGPLATLVGDLAGKSYTSSLWKQVHEKKRPVIVSTETGRLKCQNIVHVVAPVITEVSENSLKVISDIYRLALTHDYFGKIKQLAMPLTGTGMCSGKSDIQTLCQCVVSTIVGACIDTVQPQIKEFHIVNIDPSSTMHIQNEFRARTSPSYKTSSSIAVSVQQTNRARSGEQLRKDVDIDGWIKHKPLQDVPVKAEKTLISANTKPSLITKDAPENCKCVYCRKKATQMLSCEHAFCKACLVSIRSGGVCTKCASSSASASADCPICLETIAKPKELPCKHKMCVCCFERMKKPECPLCQHIFGIIIGNQPPGEMFYRYINWENLPGYDQCGVIQIFYDIPGGKQLDDHPNPGAFYKGTQRYAFLPDNDSGKEVLRLFRIAFDRKLIFTVGESRTTGREGVVTWNDIHHKTKPDGGADRFGYPDSSYLTRVKEELATKGVTI